jgi:hypothetical protein
MRRVVCTYGLDRLLEGVEPCGNSCTEGAHFGLDWGVDGMTGGLLCPEHTALGGRADWDACEHCPALVRSADLEDHISRMHHDEEED